MDRMDMQEFLYEEKEGSAVIWRCFSRETRAEIPRQLGGLPVTELAPYAFSGHQEPEALLQGAAQGELCVWKKAERAPALCGNQLEEIVLPDTVKKIGRYCFYNCKELRELEVPGGKLDWGSGVFTGCHRIQRISIRGKNTEFSLREVLEEIREKLRVEFLEEGKTIAALVFPEYYEEGVENTPARILENHVHGTGILYRNCAGGGGVDYSRYDRLFPLAKAQEPEEVLLELVLGRLQYPLGLSKERRDEYEGFLLERWDGACSYAVKERDMETVKLLARAAKGQRGYLEKLGERAAGGRFPEAASWCMHGLGQTGAAGKGRRRLEL